MEEKRSNVYIKPSCCFFCKIEALCLCLKRGCEILVTWVSQIWLFTLIAVTAFVFVVAVLGYPPEWCRWRDLLDHKNLGAVGTVTGILVSAWLVTRELTQRRYEQAWLSLQEQVQKTGIVTLEHVQSWYTEKLYRNQNLYPLLGDNDWINVLEGELRRRPFRDFHPSANSLRIFLQLAFWRTKSPETKRLFLLLLCWQRRMCRKFYHHKVLFWVLRWWKEEAKYRPEGWVILAWMLWWRWEQTRRENGKGQNGERDQQLAHFCCEIQKLFEEVQSKEKDPFLASLLVDEVLQRAGIRCPAITAAAYKPEKTLWHVVWSHKWKQQQPPDKRALLEVADEPKDWPWAGDNLKDPEEHLVIVAEHEQDRWWAMKALHDFWWEKRTVQPIFPVMIPAWNVEALWPCLADAWLYWIAPDRNPWAFWGLAGHNQRRLLGLFQRAYASKEVWTQRLWALWFASNGTDASSVSRGSPDRVDETSLVHERDASAYHRGLSYEKSLLMRWGASEPAPSTLAQEVQTFLVVPPALRREEPWRVWFIYASDHTPPLPLDQEKPSQIRDLWRHLAHHRAFLRAVLPPKEGERVAREVGARLVRIRWEEADLERTWARWLRKQRGFPPDSRWPWEKLIRFEEHRERVKRALAQAEGSLGRFLEGVQKVMKDVMAEGEEQDDL